MLQSYDYTVIFVPDPDGGYVAEVPMLGIATQGETLGEVRTMAQDAIRGYIETLAKAGEPVPTEPRGPARRIVTESDFFFITKRAVTNSIVTKGHTVCVPVHPRDLKRGTLASIVKQSGLSREDFLALC